MQTPGGPQTTWTKPGPVLKVVLLGIFAIWLLFALGNWGGPTPTAFAALTGNTDAIVGGEFWRLLTAPLLHVPSQTVSHILMSMLLLYFFGAPLEAAWGKARFSQFLFLSGLLAYGSQALLGWALPASITSNVIPADYFGASPIVEACIIAWASTFRGRTVMLFFVLPVTSRTLILFTVGYNLLSLIAQVPTPSGHLALFAGMGFGWLLGGDTPSPVRKFYLRFRLAELEREAQKERRSKRDRVQRSGLKVVPGGKRDDSPPTDLLN